MSKKRIRRNIWIKKGYLIAKKASKFTYMRKPKRFIKKQLNRKVFGFGNFFPKFIPAIDFKQNIRNIID